MIETEVCLYLVSDRRIALLEKVIAFVALPRLGDFVKLANRKQGDHFAFSVVQVTHRENGRPEVWLQLTSSVGGRSKVDFFEDVELDEYVSEYRHEG